MSSGGEVELLSGGPEREPRPPRGPLFGGWRPPPLVTAVLVAVVAGAVWGGYALTAPKIPPVHVTEQVAAPGDGGDPLTPWQPAFGGRPAAGVDLKVKVVISAPGKSGETVTVLGMAGPGIKDSSSRPIVLAAEHPTPAVLEAAIDCAQVSFPVQPTDYRIRMQVVGGSRTTTGTIAGGAVSTRWAAAVDHSCGSWLARRDLTVVQASATIDAQRASADLTVRITNKGGQPAYLGFGWNYGAITVTAPASRETVLAPRTMSTLHLHVDIGSCDSVPASFPTFSGNEFTTSSDYLGIVAYVGSHPPAPNPDTKTPLDGAGPTGIVLARGARTAIAEALRGACADLNQFVTLIAPDHGFTLDPRTGVLTVRVNIDGTPGKVSDVVLISDPGPSDNSAYQPLWTSISGLVPDSAGQVTATLTYHVPVTSPCPSLGAWIPGFTLLAHVPVDGHVKTLRYGQYVDPSQDTGAIDALCNF